MTHKTDALASSNQMRRWMVLCDKCRGQTLCVWTLEMLHLLNRVWLSLREPRLFRKGVSNGFPGVFGFDHPFISFRQRASCQFGGYGTICGITFVTFALR